MKPAGRVRRRESMGEGDLEGRDEKGQCTVRAGDVRQPDRRSSTSAGEAGAQPRPTLLNGHAVLCLLSDLVGARQRLEPPLLVPILVRGHPAIGRLARTMVAGYWLVHSPSIALQRLTHR